MEKHSKEYAGNRYLLQVRNYLLDEGNNSLVEILEFIYEIEG